MMTTLCRLLGSTLLFIGLPFMTATAQEVVLASAGPRFLSAPTAGAAPVEIDARSSVLLRRMVSLNSDQATIGSVLAEIERQTGIRFMYSPAGLEADRPVRLRADSITVAAALTELLMDTDLDVMLSRGNQVALVKRTPVVPAADASAIVGTITDKGNGTPLVGATVVLEGTRRGATTNSEGKYRIADVAPGTYTLRARWIGYTAATAQVAVSEGQDATADFTLERSPLKLDEVVVTGTIVPTEMKAIPTPLSVITSDEIQQQNLQRIDQVFRGQVPGSIAWDSPTRDYYSVISIRGASSLFLPNSVKTFIDGVEVAFPSFLATVDPNSIDRIEILRGPEGSTLYGSDASGGVLQIFTKKGAAGLARPELAGKVSLGVADNTDRLGTTTRQDHTLTVRGGTAQTGYSINGSYEHLGEWTPSYRSTNWGLSFGAQTNQGPLTAAVSARYSQKAWDSAWITDLASYADFSTPPYQDNSLRQQTYGITLGYVATPRWQHTVTFGYDQTYQDYFTSRDRLTTPADTFRTVFAGHLAKVSVLYHTDVTVPLTTTVHTTLTAGVNYSGFDDYENYTAQATRVSGNIDGVSFPLRSSTTNTGYFGQLRLDVADQLFLTAGLRAERNPNFGKDFGTAWSPRVGVAYVRPAGSISLKARASYGESIRPPLPSQSTSHLDLYTDQLANPNLGPERQQGVDGGVDVFFGRRAAVSASYYNQRAIGLIDFVLIDGVATPPQYQYQNVGRIKNQGWEFEGHLSLGEVALSGTYSITNSTIQRLSQTYSGDYRVGDRLLGIPCHSGGATVTYTPFNRTSLSASVTHLGSWTENDVVALYGFYFGGQPYRGSNRDYWMTYPAVTKISLAASQELTPGLTGFARVDNVGGTRRFESDNINPSMGRVVTAGVRFTY